MQGTVLACSLKNYIFPVDTHRGNQESRKSTAQILCNIITVQWKIAGYRIALEIQTNPCTIDIIVCAFKNNARNYSIKY
jgi:hypothetical protein